jgi:hypothetical protein
MTVTGDEATDHAEFENYVGGVPRAFRLLRIYQESRADDGFFSLNKRTRDEVFRENAKRAGYDENEANALIAIQ